MVWEDGLEVVFWRCANISFLSPNDGLPFSVGRWDDSTSD